MTHTGTSHFCSALMPIDRSLERSYGVEWTLESGSGGVGGVWIGDNIALPVLVLDGSQRGERGGFLSSNSCEDLALANTSFPQDQNYIPG